MPDMDGNDVEDFYDAIQDQGSEEPTPPAVSIALGGMTAAKAAALVFKQIGQTKIKRKYQITRFSKQTFKTKYQVAQFSK